MKKLLFIFSLFFLTVCTTNVMATSYVGDTFNGTTYETVAAYETAVLEGTRNDSSVDGYIASADRVNSGKYLTTFSNYGNSGEENVLAVISDYLKAEGLLGDDDSLSNFILEDTVEVEATPTIHLESDIFKDGDDGNPEGIAGTWSTNPVTDLAYFVVKGSTSFSLHALNPAISSGTWNTTRLLNAGGSGTIPGISFFRGVEDPAPVPAPVPEPATMLLLGIGLVTLAGFRKKFKN